MRNEKKKRARRAKKEDELVWKSKLKKEFGFTERLIKMMGEADEIHPNWELCSRLDDEIYDLFYSAYPNEI